MAKAEMDMVRDILGWNLPDSQKLSLIRQVMSERPAAPAVAAQAPVVAKKTKKTRKTKKARKARKAGLSARQMQRVSLWAELKKVAPEKAASLNYGDLSADKLAAILANLKK